MDQSRNPAGALSLDRSLALLVAMLADRGATPLSRIATDLGIPRSTATRIVTTMQRRGLVMRVQPGHYRAGPALAALDLPDARGLLAQAARPTLRALTRKLAMTAHLGVFEHGMVTYVAKENGRVRPIFTREDHQLEAYCSGLGKVLLAAQGAAAIDAYCADGMLVALTPQTITDPVRLRAELEAVAHQGYAEDREEIANGLRCMAVPIRHRDGRVLAALSVSGAASRIAAMDRDALLRVLNDSSEAIVRRMAV